MLKRHFTERLNQLLNQFPAVAILGPRQCGKTTWIKKTFPSWHYIDLERPSDLAMISQDPEYNLEQLGEHIIFDEAQQFPGLFPILRSLIDEKRLIKGRFIILGSASLSLIKHISESLAGRIGFLDMTPFNWREVYDYLKKAEKTNYLWLRGGFPDALTASSQAECWNWFEAYTRTFIERDLYNLGINVAPVQMRKIWSMLAHSHGALWNASTLASALGVSYHTINRYTNILEQTFLVRRLSPYFRTIPKRIVKRPKIYIRDSGLLHYFLGIHHQQTLDVHPARGSSWEGFVIEQIIGVCQLSYPAAQFYYWRTVAGAEIDLLIEKNGNFFAIEIKIKTTPNKQDVLGLINGMKDLKIETGYVICNAGQPYSMGNGIHVMPFNHFMENFNDLLT